MVSDSGFQFSIPTADSDSSVESSSTPISESEAESEFVVGIENRNSEVREFVVYFVTTLTAWPSGSRIVRPRVKPVADASTGIVSGDTSPPPC
jgi:hypothetical protein